MQGEGVVGTRMVVGREEVGWRHKQGVPGST